MSGAVLMYSAFVPMKTVMGRGMSARVYGQSSVPLPEPPYLPLGFASGRHLRARPTRACRHDQPVAGRTACGCACAGLAPLANPGSAGGTDTGRRRSLSVPPTGLGGRDPQAQRAPRVGGHRSVAEWDRHGWRRSLSVPPTMVGGKGPASPKGAAGRGAPQRRSVGQTRLAPILVCPPNNGWGEGTRKPKGRRG